MSYDIIIKNGLYFDGSGAPGAVFVPAGSPPNSPAFGH